MFNFQTASKDLVNRYVCGKIFFMETSEKIALYAVVFNLGLVAFKTLLSWYSGSLALTAEVIHSLTDVITSAAILVGIKLSKRRSASFPYGLYKIENLISLIVSLLIVGAGIEVVKTAFGESRGLHVSRLPLTAAGVGLAMMGAYLFSCYEHKKGKELNSPSLISDAQHLRSDVLSAIAIMAGLMGEYLGLRLDKAVAIVVAIFIIRAGAQIFIDSIRVLLDASVDFATLDKVKNIVLSHPEVEEIKAIWGRNSGRYKFIELIITLKVNSLKKAHIVSHEIEQRIKAEIPHVDHILIQYEPREKDFLVYAVPLAEDKHTLSDHFGDAPYFYFCKVGLKDKKIHTEKIEINPYTLLERGRGIEVSKWLLNKGIDIVLTRKELTGKGPFFVLSEAGVEIKTTQCRNLDEVKQMIFQKKEENN